MTMIETARTSITGVVALMMTTTACRAAAKGPTNMDDRGIAIHGFDPVAYFTQGRAIPGRGAHHYRWRDADWRFASAAHRDLFVGEPTRYAPRYGGYCAWAVSQGYTADVDPKAWKIVDGKLYLNHDGSVQERWEARQADSIQRANANWPAIRALLEQRVRPGSTRPPRSTP